MKKYTDYQDDKTKSELTDQELGKIDWTRFKIVVPTDADKQEIMDAFEHMHYADIDTDFVTVNQLVHEYLEGTNIIVNEELFKKLI